MDNKISYERYQRQLLLKDFGEAGQHKLFQAAVSVIGAGGLGCALLQYLVAAGVGRIGIIDDDIVSLSNLHRQVLYSTDDIGLPKAKQAIKVLSRLNPEIDIIGYNERLTVANALTLMEEFDIIVDCTDNFATRYLINDASVLLDKPLVYGAVSRFEGQVAIFNCKTVEKPEAVNYRDLYPTPPKDGEILNCEEAGVLGVLPGIIGAMQANETIKLLTGMGRPLINRLLNYDALNNNIYELELTARKETRLLIPADRNAFMTTDYELLCNKAHEQIEIDHAFFDQLLQTGAIDVVDVRELDEAPLIDAFSSCRIPLGQLATNLQQIKFGTVVIICQTGKRSLQAAKQLADVFGSSKKIYSLHGGILQWKHAHSKQLS